LRQSCQLVAPANLDADFACTFDEEILKVILLQIDEGGHLVPILGQEIELPYLFVAGKYLANLPDDALIDAWLTYTVSIEYFERAFSVANAPRTLAYTVSIVDQKDINAAKPEIERKGETDRTRTDHNDGMANGFSRILVRMPPVAEAEQGLSLMLLASRHLRQDRVATG
jgi:hypothetical protein